MGFRRVLAAVDAEPTAARAAEVAIGLARSPGAQLALIHPVDPALGCAPESGIPAAERLRRAQQDGRRLLASLRPREALVPPPLEPAPLGMPAAEIVAEAVMRHAPCPVLVVRAED